MNTEFLEINDDRLVAWIILIQDSLFELPDATYCKQYEAQHAFSMPLLFDPTGATSIYGGKETSIVTNENGTIVFEGHSDSIATIRAAVEAELATPHGQCNSAVVCSDNEYCLPLPVTETGNICTTTCTYGDDSTCPEGQTCWRYSEDKTTGACFMPELLPTQ
jgi:hypothetical protein